MQEQISDRSEKGVLMEIHDNGGSRQIMREVQADVATRSWWVDD